MAKLLYNLMRLQFQIVDALMHMKSISEERKAALRGRFIDTEQAVDEYCKNHLGGSANR